MEKKIIYYKLNGEIKTEELLNEDTLGNTNGMMIKCYMKTGIEETGFSNPYRTHNDNFDGEVHDYIELWTWDNLDEEKHKLIGNIDSKYNQTFRQIKIADIIKIEAILNSNPRYGGRLTNSFDYFVSQFTKDKK